LIRSGDNWLGRWREDVEDDTGAVKRVHKKEVIGTVEDFPTKRLAERELQRRLEPINNVEYRPQRRITFEVFSQKWLKEVLVHQKRSSQSSARSHVRVHLIPAFGAMSLADLRMEVIQQFVTGSKMSPKTVKNVVVTLMSMWSTAQAWGYVQHNPFPRGASGRLLLKLPAAAPCETYHFTPEEYHRIVEKAEGPWKAFFRVLAKTGVRPGELAGLRRDAVGDHTLTITQSVWGQKLQTPKSRAGVRTVAIDSRLASELRKLVDGTPENKFGLMFVTKAGKPLSIDNFRQRVLNPILAELKIDQKLKGLGIKRCGLYAFRHMNATLMDTINAPMKTRMKRLGHAQIETTLKHYTHAQDADDLAVAETIGVLLDTKQSGEVVQ
jgi:integrase